MSATPRVWPGMATRFKWTLLAVGLLLLTTGRGDQARAQKGGVNYKVCGNSTCDGCRDYTGGFCIIEQNQIVTCVGTTVQASCEPSGGSNPKCSGKNYTGGACDNQQAGVPDGTTCALVVSLCK